MNYYLYVQSYHSGIPAKDRSRVQDLFCSNKIKVVRSLIILYWPGLLGCLGFILFYTICLGLLTCMFLFMEGCCNCSIRNGT